MKDFNKYNIDLFIYTLQYCTFFEKSGPSDDGPYIRFHLFGSPFYQPRPLVNTLIFLQKGMTSRDL